MRSHLLLIVIALCAMSSCVKPHVEPAKDAQVNTEDVTGITYTTVVTNGYVVETGGEEVLERGIVWAVTSNPTTTLSNKVNSIPASGKFSILIKNLTPATKYYIRAFLINSKGTYYGAEVNFTTLDYLLPTVRTKEISVLDHSRVSVAGEITAKGGTSISQRGVVWSLNPEPTTSNYVSTYSGSEDSFSLNLSGLSPETRYYIRAFAVNSKGTSYGEQLSCVTDSHLENTYHIYLPVSNASTSGIDIKFADRKYNKGFIVSMTSDDSNASSYSTLWALINNKPIGSFIFSQSDPNQGPYYHANQAAADDYPTNSIKFGKTLAVTDGCNNEIRFHHGSSIWPNAGTVVDEVFSVYMDDHNTVGAGFRFKGPYLQWVDLQPMFDFGGSIYQHDVNKTKWNVTDPSKILQGFAEDYAKTISNAGRKMKIMAEPEDEDAEIKYIEAALSYPNYVMNIGRLSGELLTNSQMLSANLNKLTVKRSFYKSEKIMEWLQESYSVPEDDRIWAHFGMNTSVGQDWIDCLKNVYDYFGKDGNDDVWFATMDEVYEYYWMRREAKITKTIENGKLHIIIKLPKTYDFYFRNITLNISGVSVTQSATASDNVIGMASALKAGYYMINLDFESSLMASAEKYTAIFEVKRTRNAKADAIYFANRLAPSAVKTTILSRINEIVPND